MKENLGWKLEPAFYVPDEVYENMNEYINDGIEKENNWNQLFKNYAVEYPELAKEYAEWMSGKIDKNALDSDDFWVVDEKPMATRQSSGNVINKLSKIIPNLIGGSADLAPSNKTHMNCRGDFFSRR